MEAVDDSPGRRVVSHILSAPEKQEHISVTHFYQMGGKGFRDKAIMYHSKNEKTSKCI